MTVKELNKFKNKMYHEIIKIPDVANELKYSNVVYVYDISERAKHMVVVFSDERHLHENFLKENGFTKDAFVEKLYTVDKVTKTCY